MSMKIQLSSDNTHAKVGSEKLSAPDIDKLIRDLRRRPRQNDAGASG